MAKKKKIHKFLCLHNSRFTKLKPSSLVKERVRSESKKNFHNKKTKEKKEGGGNFPLKKGLTRYNSWLCTS